MKRFNWSPTKIQRRSVAFIAVGAAAASAFALTASGAGAVVATSLTDPAFGGSGVTTAYNLAATGGLATILPTVSSDCVGVTAPTKVDELTLNLGTLANVIGLHTECNIAPRTDLSEGKAKITSISLLNSAIQLTGLTSKCSITKTGAATCGSTVAQLNGKDLVLGPLSIVIPGVAAVYIDKNTEVTNPDGSETITTEAAEVDVAPVVVLGKTITAGETIVVDSASVTQAPQIED